MMVRSATRNLLKPDILILAAIVCMTCFNAGLSYITKIKTGSDVLASYKVVHSYQKGAKFNHIRVPVNDNLAETAEHQLTWWTLGQYVLPWMITSLTKFPIYVSEWIVVTLSLLSFTLGMYFLLKQLGFSNVVTNLSIALILSSQAILFRYHVYDGGTTLLDAVWPWVALVIVRGNASISAAILFTVLSLFAFFMKSSFLIIFIALSLFYIFRTTQWPTPKKRIQDAITQTLKSMGTLATYLLCAAVIISTVYFGYIIQGDSPNSVSLRTHNTIPGSYNPLRATLYPIAAPMDFFSQPASYLIKKHSRKHQLTYTLWIILLSSISLFIILYALRSRSFPTRYRQFLLAFIGAYLSLFWYFYHTQVPISMEPRHFYPFAFVLLPAFLLLIGKHLNKTFVYAIVPCFLFLAAINQYLFIKHRILSATNRVQIDDYYYPKESLETVQVIKSLDQQYNGSAVFYITPWDRFLEFAVKANKVYPLGLGGTGIPRFRKTPYFNPNESHSGRPGALIVLTAHNSEVPTSWFPDYNAFTLLQKTSTHLIWIGN